MSTMRSAWFSLTVAIGLSAVVAASAATLPPVRIMPLGDSITRGTTPGGYRAPLYASLKSLGYTVDYVGTQTDNAGSLPDPDHEGHSGWTIGMIDSSINGFLDSVAAPNVILLHIGTNDSNPNNLSTFANAIGRLDALITKIAAKRPYAHIIVTSLLPRTDEPSNTAITNLFNPYVPGVVAAQAALGRRVSFLDMYACLTTNDLADIAHPTQTGYNKMAAAWLPAITNLIAPSGDLAPPALVSARSLSNNREVAVTFSKPVNPATATNIVNYALSGDLAISSAALDADPMTVTLSTSLQAPKTSYVVTVNNVTDWSLPSPLSISDNSQFSFLTDTPSGYLNNVPESSAYTLVYSLDVPASVNYKFTPIAYSADNHLAIGDFSRVAYYMELLNTNGALTYVWASMNAFTNDTAALGVPTLLSGVVLHNPVYNMNVYCNVPGVTTGSGFTGNLEFWPYSYVYANTYGVPGASDSTCDFGDGISGNGLSYGSMQVHNTGAGQTLFAFNAWCDGGSTEIGIGNQPTGQPDWTFAKTAGAYSSRKLQVLVLRDSDATPPTLVSANASLARTLVTVSFSEPLAPSSVNGTCFALDNGVTVVSATLAANQRDVTLVTTRQPPGTLTLTVTGVRDSAAGNPITPGSAIVVASPVLPPEITARVGAPAAGYQVVYSLDIPVTGSFNGAANPYSVDQRSATNIYDRIAYYLELQKADGSVQYIWTSMDAFTPYLSRIGVPTASSKAIFQQAVNSLDVLSNVAGITNGTGMTGGNIEFWPTGQTTTNAMGVANASDSTYDFGDTRLTNGTYGCMQVHNSNARQTLFALNNWGADNNTLCVGIGNAPFGSPDWTGTNNASVFFRRTLHVLVRPAAGSTNSLPAEVAANVPLAAGYQMVCSITNIPVNGTFNTSSADYSADIRASATNPFSRVAYYLELKKTGLPATFIWTSMDAFTTNALQLGIPVGGTAFQQKVTRLDVFSNQGDIINGMDIATGNIEFWPSDFSPPNTLSIPGASATAFDFGDGGGTTNKGGHGCMQVHNYGAQQTLFAINHFNNVNKIGLGIGNNPVPNATYPDPDWTATYNADTYERRVLHVFVLFQDVQAADAVAPTLTGVTASSTLQRVLVKFSETLADSAADIANFSVNNGVTVTAAALSADKKSVQLTTSAQTPGQTYLVSVTGVRDRSASANLIAAGASISFTAPYASLPPHLSGSVQESSDYALIYQLAIPGTAYFVPNGAPYSVDESLFPQTQPFDRLAYCMELVTKTTFVSNWVYVSMNPFTSDLAKIGVPTAARGAAFQQYVANMNVYASPNVSVTTGTGIATGNIEFFPSNYSGANDKNITNALGGTYVDFGDSTGSTSAGHGSMQIHNFGASHTILSLSHFGNNNMQPALGFGNNANFTISGYTDTDWSFNYNANTFGTKNLYVLARWGGTPQGTGPALLTQPVSREVRANESARFYVQAVGATFYQWRRNGVAIDGANQAWLEISPATLEDSGTYDVLVYGAGTASTASQAATLRVIPRGTLLRLR